MTVAQQTNPRSYPDATPRKVAFLGLGVMGWPMAGHLALAGHTVTVFNRTACCRKGLHPGLCFGSRAVEHRDRVPGQRQMPRHGPAHYAQS